ncbi:MAG: 2,3-bisphosphoglycerate-independent phosphoglycerate mutase [Gammaproteobacteria bacterium]|nr:2,3-bisphosphoglycerate-independent phosphoglycerate mutase [Gammaproteobacteria bacterium]
MDTHKKLRKPVLLIIMDGFGLNPETENNGIALANTPHLDELFTHYPMTPIKACGNAVGLPEGQMGNSEVGHLTIGSGSIQRQDLVRIDDAIRDGSFRRNAALRTAMARSRTRGRPVHLIGLCSDGGVHSHVNHLKALIDMCGDENVIPSLHMITDGRDTAPNSAMKFLEQIQPKLEAVGGYVSTVSGRFFAMDRDKRWERTIKVWEAMIHGQGMPACAAQLAIVQAYEMGQSDEFIVPTVITGGQCIQPGDGVIFFNFRNDRARQLTYMLAGKEFLPFDRGEYQPVELTCLTEYDPQLPLPIAFTPEAPRVTLAETLSNIGVAQLHCAETEKYAHVTFFLNGGREQPYPLEQRIMINSPAVETYDMAPEMSAAALADTVINAVQEGEFGFIVCNFANGDMVGHTANRNAVIQAVETLDTEVYRVVEVAKECGYSVVLTADHGNCELLLDPVTGLPHTQHTTFPVPCVIIDSDVHEINQEGGLSQIAATILELMGLSVPPQMRSSLLSHFVSGKINAA